MRKITQQEFIDHIFQADAEELNQVMDAVTERFTEIWHEYEQMIMSSQEHATEAHLQALDKTRTIYEGLRQSGHE